MDVFQKRVIDPNRVPVFLKYGPKPQALTEAKDRKTWQLMGRVNKSSRQVEVKPPSEKAELRGCQKNTGVFRLWDHYQCDCHQHADDVIKTVLKPGNKFWERMTLRGTDYGCVRRHRQHMEKNAIPQFPLATILIRWRPDVIQYNRRTLHQLLSIFGNIVKIQYLNATCVIVVFDDFVDSCKLISRANFLWFVNKVYCTWWHKCLQNKRFIGSYPGGLKVLHNVFMDY